LVGNCIHRAAQTVSTSHAPTIFSYSPAHDTSYKFLITTYEQPIRHNPKRKITVVVVVVVVIIIIIIIIIMHYVQYCHVLGCGLSLFTLVMYTVSFLSAHQQSPLKLQEFLRKFLINSSLS
jgi:uncharacterized membrane protein YkgB